MNTKMPINNHFGFIIGLFSVLFLTFLITLLLYLFTQLFSHFIYEDAYSDIFIQSLSNPLIALLFGALASVIVRSSSIVITILAAMVIAGFPFSTAIFIVFGANIGTTILGSLVNIVPDSQKKDKQRIMIITSMHYFNNIIAFCLFFPLQLSTHFFDSASQGSVNYIVSLLLEWTPFSESVRVWDSSELINIMVSHLTLNAYSITTIFILVLMIIFMMRLFFIVLRHLFDPFVMKSINQQVYCLQDDDMDKKALLLGIKTAATLQSSNSSFYILMPLVRKIGYNIRAYYPMILGINVGTCLTTIFFALLLQSELAMAIGLAHLFYNVLALLVFNYVPFIKELPILASKNLAMSSY